MNYQVNNYLQNFTFFHTCMVSLRVFLNIFQCLTSKNVYLRMLRTRIDRNVISWNSWSDLYYKLILFKWFYFLKLKTLVLNEVFNYEFFCTYRIWTQKPRKPPISHFLDGCRRRIIKNKHHYYSYSLAPYSGDR